ncbi:SGT1 and CS domain-containing protein [Lophiotrema nucula]|uniref:SGT1 and CS domain-containing protein n=1 Tax=Lophiotrema nucula TaxID=690887 RepID=A0A6A5YI19_9PLEO|nr:SGT1 and CS domain-containing protein [Lophiotrema nucula]
MDQAARGATALAAGKYEEAIEAYTSAISTNANAVDYYIKRSTAYQRSSKHPQALADAEIAVVLAHKRAKRELIKDAQLRRGIALFHNERYKDAEFVLDIVKRLDEKEKTLTIWNMKVAKKLEGLTDDDEKAQLTAKEVPDVELPSAEVKKEAKADSKADAKADAPPAPAPVAPTPANKIKHDWYQNNDNVYFSLLAKGVPKDKASVDIDKDSMTISFPIQGSTSDFNYSIDPFFAEVDPTASTWTVKSTKIEVVLKKAQPGVKWHALEDSQRKPSTPKVEDKPEVPTEVLAATSITAKGPVYPTSSRKGPQNWDTFGNDDPDLAEGDGDETTRFFKTLYKGAGPDQQRAMMKSYQESGGTVLSTDWSNVGGRTVVPEPPDGMEAKKY